MDAVVVLCHYCEHHGPAMVLCTQPYRPTDDGPLATLSSADNPGVPFTGNYIPCSKMATLTGMTASNGSSNSSGLGQAASGSNQAANSLSSTCKACRSIGRDELGFVSNDHMAKTSYLTTQHPDDKLHEMLRRASLLSLSCETCPGREGPIYFGDDFNGHVLSYTFQLADARARGLYGNFSILLVTHDKLFLLNAWPFLVANIKRMINRLQEAAERVNRDDQARRSTRAARLGGSSGDLQHPRTYEGELRSLAELIDDEQIFCRIHSWFTWLLRASARRWTEHVLEGSPREDQLVSKERLEASGLGLDAMGNTTLSSSAGDSDSGPLELDMGPDEKSFRLLPITNLRRLRRILGFERFNTLCYNTVIGNQIVVRSPIPKLSALFLTSLTKLIPVGCVTMVLDSAQYLPPFQCNLLSVGVEVSLPTDVLQSTSEGVLLVDLTLKSSDDDTDLEERSLVPTQLAVQLSKPPPAPYSPFPSTSRPHLLDEIARAIVPSHTPRPSAHDPEELIPDSTVDLVLLSIREHWLNKARLLYAFKRCEAPTLTNAEAESQYRAVLSSLNCTEGSGDEALVRFWFKGLSQHFRNNVCHVNKHF